MNLTWKYKDNAPIAIPMDDFNLTQIKLCLTPNEFSDLLFNLNGQTSKNKETEASK